MKKTTTYPDGTVEVLEGTAEEIKALEGVKGLPFDHGRILKDTIPVKSWWYIKVNDNGRLWDSWSYP